MADNRGCCNDISVQYATQVPTIWHNTRVRYAHRSVADQNNCGRMQRANHKIIVCAVRVYQNEIIIIRLEMAVAM